MQYKWQLSAHHIPCRPWLAPSQLVAIRLLSINTTIYVLASIEWNHCTLIATVGLSYYIIAQQNVFVKLLTCKFLKSQPTGYSLRNGCANALSALNINSAKVSKCM